MRTFSVRAGRACGNRPFRYPWEWLEPATSHGCPFCGELVEELSFPSRRFNIICPVCFTLFNSFTHRIVSPGIAPGGGEAAGVREPRRPPPSHGSGSAAISA